MLEWLPVFCCLLEFTSEYNGLKLKSPTSSGQFPRNTGLPGFDFKKVSLERAISLEFVSSVHFCLGFLLSTSVNEHLDKGLLGLDLIYL